MTRTSRQTNLAKFLCAYEYDDASSATRARIVHVMEIWQGGGLLDKVMRLGPGRGWTPEHAAQAFSQMVVAAKALHEADGTGSFVHGDIKLDNAFVSDITRDAFTILGDFGGAAWVPGTPDNPWREIRRPDFVGTSVYAAPEQLVQNRADGLFVCSPASDVWSLGVCLYCMLNGSFPFPMELGDRQRRRIVSGRHYAFQPHVPSDAQALVASMLAVDPRRRPTAAAVLGDSWLRRTEQGSLADTRHHFNPRTVGCGSARAPPAPALPALPALPSPPPLPPTPADDVGAAGRAGSGRGGVVGGVVAALRAAAAGMMTSSGAAAASSYSSYSSSSSRLGRAASAVPANGDDVVDDDDDGTATAPVLRRHVSSSTAGIDEDDGDGPDAKGGARGGGGLPRHVSAASLSPLAASTGPRGRAGSAGLAGSDAEALGRWLDPDQARILAAKAREVLGPGADLAAARLSTRSLAVLLSAVNMGGLVAARLHRVMEEDFGSVSLPHVAQALRRMLDGEQRIGVVFRLYDVRRTGAIAPEDARAVITSCPTTSPDFDARKARCVMAALAAMDGSGRGTVRWEDMVAAASVDPHNIKGLLLPNRVYQSYAGTSSKSTDELGAWVP